MAKDVVLLNGSLFLKELDLDERFNIIPETLYISNFSLFPHQEVDRENPKFAPTEKLTRTVKIDIEKRLEEILKTKKPKYVVLDFSQTVMRGLIEIEGEFYTRSNKFKESLLYKEHEAVAKEYVFLDEETPDWHAWMDHYIEGLLKTFNKNRIILIHMPCPRYYVSHEQVRLYNGKQQDQYNQVIAAMEAYFVEKTNCYHIDVNRYYYLRQKANGDYNMATFEHACHAHVRRIIRTIVRTIPQQRYFNEEEFFIRVHRYIRYYDSVWYKGMQRLFLDERKFLDHLVLSLGKKSLEVYERELIRFYDEGFESFEDIFQNYNFHFIEGLKELLKVVRALWEGNIYRENVDYALAWETQMPILPRLIQLLTMEYEEISLIDGPIYMRENNVDVYFKALMYYRNDQHKALKKHVMNLKKDPDAIFSIGDLLKEEKGKGIEPEVAMIRAMNRLYENVTLDVWGSDLSLDVIHQSKGKVVEGEVIYRNSPLFAFEPPCDISLDYEDLSRFGNKTFLRDAVKSAIVKDVPERLSQSGNSWIVVDFFDFACMAATVGDRHFGADKKVRKLKFYQEIQNIDSLKKMYHVFTPEEVKERMDLWIAFLKKRYGDHIILIKADIKTHYLTGSRELKKLNGFRQDTLLAYREYVSEWQDYFTKQCPCHVIDHARKCEADDYHPRGAFIINYEERFYKKSIKDLYGILKGSDVSSLYK